MRFHTRQIKDDRSILSEKDNRISIGTDDQNIFIREDNRISMGGDDQSETSDFALQPLAVEIDKLKDAQDGVWFGSKEYDHILRDLIAVGRDQDAFDLEKLTGKQENIESAEKEYAYEYGSKPERYYGDIIHELEHGNKENHDSKRYNRILEDLKELDGDAREAGEMDRKATRKLINREVVIFDKMRSYVLAKYGEVRDKKSEVWTKKDGKRERVRLGYTFRLENEDGKKPLEPSSKTVNRTKLMLESMERLGNQILSRLPGCANENEIKMIQEQFDEKNGIFGIQINVGAPKKNPVSKKNDLIQKNQRQNKKKTQVLGKGRKK